MSKVNKKYIINNTYNLEKIDMDYDDQILEMLENAELLKIQGEFEEAIKLLNKIIITEPECVEAYEELGDNFLSLRKYGNSKKALIQALKIDSKSSNAHYLLGFLLSATENWADSIKELEKADLFAPNHPEILRCLGWAVFNKNRRSQGISILERSHNLNPNDPNILCDLGVCYMNAGQSKEARSMFQNALKVDPFSQQAKECIHILEAIDLENKK